MRFLEPEIITPVKMTIKNNITGELQVAWFKTVAEANDVMNNIENNGVLGTDYWIQNTPRGSENVVKFKDETIVPGAVYLQEVMHPTNSSATIRFYVVDNETGVNMVHTKLLKIDYLCEMYGMTKVSVYSISPQNDMLQRADITAYLPGNLVEMEDKIIKNYIQIYIMAAVGPMADLVNDETHTEEHHHHEEEQPKQQANGFKVTPKQPEDMNTEELKKKVEEDLEHDEFDYDPNELESDQSVQLPEDRY